MIGGMYAGTAFICCVVIIIILNRTLYLDLKSKAQNDFLSLLNVSIIFCVVDTSWGIFSSSSKQSLQVPFTISSYCFHIMIAITAFCWYRYILNYFSFKVASKLYSIIIPLIFLFVQFITIIANLFFPLVFLVNENNQYITEPFRMLNFIMQFATYFIIFVISLVTFFVSKEQNEKKLAITAIVFSLIPLASNLAQYIFPFFPVYSAGTMLSCFTIYAYNITSEHENLLRESKEMELHLEHENELQNDYAIINSISGRVDYICLVNTEDNSIVNYRVAGIFKKYIDPSSSSFTNSEFDDVFKSLIPQEEFSTFLDMCDRRSVMLTLHENNNYRFFFNIMDDDEKLQYCITFSLHPTNESCVIISLKNVSEELKEKREKEEAIYRASIDGLTGLLNKSTYITKINDCLSHKKTSDCAFIYFDIDFFKNINDEFGHSKGDQVLQDVADKIKTMFEQIDKKILIARLGGDEYSIFIPNLTSLNLEDILSSLHNTLISTISYENNKIDISGSIGCAVCSFSNVNYEILHDTADSAMYEVKKNGKNGYKIIEVQAPYSQKN